MDAFLYFFSNFDDVGVNFANFVNQNVGAIGLLFGSLFALVFLQIFTRSK